jgi:hypothetical protein
LPPTTRRLAAGPCNGAVLLAALVALAACGGQPGKTPAAADSPSPSSAENDLVVEIDRGDGSAGERYTLSCSEVVEGDHPAAEAACAHLEGMDDPFAPLPPDAICTQVYGGPQTAHVTGVWHGRSVDVQLARNDGCTIAQWDGLGPLLPGPPA